MNGHIARVTRLEYRNMNPSLAQQTDALVVSFRTADGEVHEHDVPNPQWGYNNLALQFMARQGFKPTEIEGTAMNVRDWEWFIPIVREVDSGDCFISPQAFAGGAEALQDAEWFTPLGEENDDSDDSGGPHGGGSPDPGTGNRAGVEHDDGGVTAELTPEADTGVNIKIQ